MKSILTTAALILFAHVAQAATRTNCYQVIPPIQKLSIACITEDSGHGYKSTETITVSLGLLQADHSFAPHLVLSGSTPSASATNGTLNAISLFLPAAVGQTAPSKIAVLILKFSAEGGSLSTPAGQVYDLKTTGLLL